MVSINNKYTVPDLTFYAWENVFSAYKFIFYGLRHICSKCHM